MSMTFWQGIGIGFSAGIFATLAAMLALRHTEGQPEPDLSWMGEAERRMRDG